MRQAKLYRYTIAVETGVILRHRRLQERQGLIVQLCDGNQQGWGEIAPLPEFSQETLDIAEQQVKQCLKAWLSELNHDLETCVPSVAFGLSCALAELNGELGEQGNFKTAPLCYGDPDELYRELNQIEGEKVAKMKVGLYEANRDGLIADMFLEAIPDLSLRLDANRSWPLEKATLFASKISPTRKSKIQFIEEPCKTPELSLQFAEKHQISIAWDETVREPNFKITKHPYVSAIVIKPTLVGSIQKCIQLIKQAHSLGMLAVISSSIESSLGLTQLARISQQYTPNTMPGLDTLGLMKAQILRAWQGSDLPTLTLKSNEIVELALD